MQRVISVSLGSSTRDHAVDTEILGETFRIERRGTDGDVKKAIAMIKELDGQVAAFGMGGIDLYIAAGNRRYAFREALPIARAARQSPIVDGSGLKNTLERRVIELLEKEYNIPLKGRKILLVSGMDRFGMAEALVKAGADVTFGDLIFALGVPIALKTLSGLDRLARILAPIVVQLPFKWLYPTGEKQEKTNPKYAHYYHENEIIAGDFHFIRRYMPEDLKGKTIITNTVTSKDVEELRRRGVALLVTTTPELNGRSFGTNVMEGVLIALAKKPWKDMTPADYLNLLEKVNFRPRVEKLN
ncbi:MAG: quinate 5-dehydrogenase [Firmicutes bacterium]|nr:quinate 5-dehydrogenase [Bacillota bacterium]MCL5040834.1 quinate 5-dehydrogenase [Bacillota bacterium]